MFQWLSRKKHVNKLPALLPFQVLNKLKEYPGPNGGDTNDCSVVTMALVTGYTYRQCQYHLAKYGRKIRTGMDLSRFFYAIEHTGHDLVPLSVFERHPFKKGEKFIVIRPRHAFAVIDGVCYDIAPDKSLHPTHVLKVVPRDPIVFPETVPEPMIRPSWFHTSLSLGEYYTSGSVTTTTTNPNHWTVTDN